MERTVLDGGAMDLKSAPDGWRLTMYEEPLWKRELQLRLAALRERRAARAAEPRGPRPVGDARPRRRGKAAGAGDAGAEETTPSAA